MKNTGRATLLPTAVVFIAVMSVVVVSFLMAVSGVRREVDTQVLDIAKTTEGDIVDRFRIFEETLWAGVGVFAGDNEVTKQDWNQFIATSAVMKRYPGAQGVGYIRVADQASLPGVVANMNQMSPGFKVFPEGQRESYAPIVYLEPQTEAAVTAIGFDIATDETRRAAFETARDTGQMTLSDVVEPVTSSNDTKAFVLYVPQYKTGLPTSTVEERRVAIEGYVFTAFIVNRFIESVVEDTTTSSVAFDIAIGQNKQQLYRTASYNDIVSGSHQTKTSVVEVGYNQLTFTYAYDPVEVLDEPVTSQPIAVLFFGTLAASLIAAAVWLILRGKANELLLSQERSVNEAKDNLLSLASHQLRTPATGVKQYLGLVLQGFAGDIPKQQQELLEKAYAGNERQLKTINDILYLARLGSGRIMLSKSSFSVRQLVLDLLDELHDEITKKDHKVTKKIPKKNIEFFGDEHMIRMVVENLLSNAIKYTHPGGKIKVSISVGTDLIITVEDNGVGIPADHQKRMFKQFERIDNDLSIAVGGTGIGLFVVQNIAELHDGKIEVTSSAEGGSTFTLTLPVQRKQ